MDFRPSDQALGRPLTSLSWGRPGRMTVQEPTVPSHGPLVWPRQRLRSFMSFGPIRETFRPLNPDFRRSDMKLTDNNGRLFGRRLLTFISVSLKNRLEAIFTWRSLSRFQIDAFSPASDWLRAVERWFDWLKLPSTENQNIKPSQGSKLILLL